MKSLKAEGIPVALPEKRRELTTEETQDAQIGLLEWELEEYGKDHLTGLSTRKEFENELERAVKAIRETYETRRLGSEPLKEVSLLFIDLDNFKRVNDEFGHAEGDKVLRNVARVFVDSVRVTDVVGRYGGDEFFIMLPRATQGEAKSVGETILRNLVSDPELDKHNITASIGVCSSAVSTNATDLVHYADTEAKRAKRTKNCVVAYGEA